MSFVNGSISTISNLLYRRTLYIDHTHEGARRWCVSRSQVAVTLTITQCRKRSTRRPIRPRRPSRTIYNNIVWTARLQQSPPRPPLPRCRRLRPRDGGNSPLTPALFTIVEDSHPGSLSSGCASMYPEIFISHQVGSRPRYISPNRRNASAISRPSLVE